MRTAISLALVVSSLAALAARAGQPPAPQAECASVTSAVGWLVSSQRPDGSFGARPERRFQTTAFVVIVLSNELLVPRTPAVGSALRSAVEYLMARQVTSGAFMDGEHDRTILGVLALLAHRDGADARSCEQYLAAALPFMPPDMVEALGAQAKRPQELGDLALVRVAFGLSRSDLAGRSARR